MTETSTFDSEALENLLARLQPQQSSSSEDDGSHESTASLADVLQEVANTIQQQHHQQKQVEVDERGDAGEVGPASEEAGLISVASKKPSLLVDVSNDVLNGAPSANDHDHQLSDSTPGIAASSGTTPTSSNPAHQPTNIFVAGVPSSWDDKKLKERFQEFGEIVSVRMVPNRHFGFVMYKNPQSAHIAIKEAHLTRPNPSCSALMHVTLSMHDEGVDDIPNERVFIRGLPQWTTKDHVRQAFGKFGHVVEASLLMNNCGQCKGAGFVVFSSVEEATAAITGCRSVRIENFDFELEVKYSETQEVHHQRQERNRERYRFTKALNAASLSSANTTPTGAVTHNGQAAFTAATAALPSPGPMHHKFPPPPTFGNASTPPPWMPLPSPTGLPSVASLLKYPPPPPPNPHNPMYFPPMNPQQPPVPPPMLYNPSPTGAPPTNLSYMPPHPLPPSQHQQQHTYGGPNAPIVFTGPPPSFGNASTPQGPPPHTMFAPPSQPHHHHHSYIQLPPPPQSILPSPQQHVVHVQQTSPHVQYVQHPSPAHTAPSHVQYSSSPQSFAPPPQQHSPHQQPATVSVAGTSILQFPSAGDMCFVSPILSEEIVTQVLQQRCGITSEFIMLVDPNRRSYAVRLHDRNLHVPVAQSLNGLSFSSGHSLQVALLS